MCLRLLYLDKEYGFTVCCLVLVITGIESQWVEEDGAVGDESG